MLCYTTARFALLCGARQRSAVLSLPRFAQLGLARLSFARLNFAWLRLLCFAAHCCTPLNNAWLGLAPLNRAELRLLGLAWLHFASLDVAALRTTLLGNARPASLGCARLNFAQLNRAGLCYACFASLCCDLALRGFARLSFGCLGTCSAIITAASAGSTSPPSSPHFLGGCPNRRKGLEALVFLLQPS